MDTLIFFLLVLYVPLVFISVTGNILIVLTVTIFKDIKKWFNIFHGNLTFADLLCTIGAIFETVYLVTGVTVYSEISSKLVGCVMQSSYYVSVIALTVTSKDSHDLDTKPLENRSTRKQKSIKLVVASLFALATRSILTYANTLWIVDDETKCTNGFSSNERLMCSLLLCTLFLWQLWLFVILKFKDFNWKWESKFKQFIGWNKIEWALKNRTCYSAATYFNDNVLRTLDFFHIHKNNSSCWRRNISDFG